MSRAGDAGGAPPAPIALLFDRLRESGYLIGVDQYVTAEALVSRMRAEGRLRDAEHLCRTLCAMVAKTAEQQRDFPRQFEAWYRYVPGPRPADQAPRLEVITNEVRRTGRRVWIAAAVLVVVVLVAVTILISTGLTSLPLFPTTGSPDGASPSTPGVTTTQTSQGFGTLLGVIAGVALLLLLLVRAVRTRQFVRRFSGVRPLLFDLGLKAVPSELAPVKPMRQAAQSLGRYDRVPTRRLDARATAAASARKGVPIVVYRDLPAVPEYIVLTDVGSADDHLAAAAEQYCERLATGGLTLHRYNFRHDPARVIARDGRVVPLARILEHSKHARLVVFSDASGFGTDTGTPLWAAGLNDLLHKVLLTPRPHAARGASERRLADLGFHVDTPDLDGIDRFATAIGQGTYPAEPPRQVHRPYPPILAGRPHRWLDDLSPDVAQVETLVAQLRTYLGTNGFRWLAATAVFPRLILPITLHVMRPAGGVLTDFGPLISLPWFRYGRMPDWLRLRLIEDLGEGDATRVRDTLQDLFISATDADPANPTLEVARHPGARLRTALLRLFRTEPPGSPFREYIFLEFMSGRRIARAAFGVPRHVRQMLRARPLRHAPEKPRLKKQRDSSASEPAAAADVSQISVDLDPFPAPLSSFERTFGTFFSIAAAAALLVILGVVNSDVFLRYVLNAPLAWGSELTAYLVPAFYLACWHLGPRRPLNSGHLLQMAPHPALFWSGVSVSVLAIGFCAYALGTRISSDAGFVQSVSFLIPLPTWLQTSVACLGFGFWAAATLSRGGRGDDLDLSERTPP